MRKDWFIDEIILKLPLLNIKLKVPVSDSKTDSDRMVLPDGLPGMKVGLKSLNGSFVTAEINRNGELIANRPS